VSDLIANWSPLPAFIVSGSLSAWCLFRAVRSTPNFLLSLLLACFAFWNLFEWLYLFTEKKYVFLQLEYLAVPLAPAVAFHYAVALSSPSRIRPWPITVVYCGAVVFVTIPLAGFVNESALDLFKADLYSAAYVAFFVPVAFWTIGLLERSRRRATDPAVRSLFSYPLLAALVMVPAGFMELAMGVFKWDQLPRLASLGALVGSIIISAGVFRYRSVYDAFAVLRRDSANVLRATVQGVLYLDASGAVVFVNSVARDLLGMNPRTLAEAGLEVPPRGRAVIRRGERILELRVAPSHDIFPPGRYVIILQDKTRDFEMMQTLASQQALASLGQAAATLAHEIRNPLTAINSAVDCIVHDTAGAHSPDPVHLELLQKEIRRLHELLERTLELGRPLKLNRQSCDLNSLIERVCQAQLSSNGSRVSLDLAPHLPPISGDPDLLAQLVLNLLKNGVEASKEVTVRTTPLPEGVVLRVSSAGARLGEEILPHLFEPFFTTKPRGTGLGLAFSKKVVQAHNGEISGRNTDRGVDFEVRLPL
jgi:signal transduction histidine kinase